MPNGKEDGDLWNRPPLTSFRTIADRQLSDSGSAATSSALRLCERVCYERMLSSCDLTTTTPARKAFVRQAAPRVNWRDKLKEQIENAEKKRMKHSSELRRFLPSVDGLVLPKLTGPTLEEIETALRPTPAHEALAKGFGMTIIRSDMSTLAEYQWLNDKVVNF
ncbi:hypothetical protein HPB47_008852 [Ixodes persulcatus]|uniref:Uncharacterized protein n=1 Tax=Ixodes persulcatus TaxID=34615 RepID=A0AC60P3V3_IXOPE|nr:hypothetical protein HPB47_008852 [Ixodes persulcatus]